MKQVSIIGLGLIGGSIGLAIKQSGLATKITGYARSQVKGAEALRLGAADEIEESLVSTVRNADLVILATPVLTMKEVLHEIASHLPMGCIVTDTASTKVDVIQWAREYLPSGVYFVGGHPMAGKEVSGIFAAEASLLKGCTYCLTPTQDTSSEALQTMVGIVNSIGANPLVINADEHDYAVAGISHLPFLLSTSLVSATTKDICWDKMSRLTAGGYRDVTRLASQDPRMTRDICFTNRQHILRWIDNFIHELEDYRDLIANESESLEESFVQNQQAREEWLAKKNKKHQR